MNVASAKTLVLTGCGLTPAALMAAARAPVRVHVDASAWGKVRDAHAILLKAAAEDQEIYGLTLGVGANKDQKELDGKDLLGPDGKLTPDAAKRSAAFNAALLNAHGAGVGAPVPPEIVRAVLIVRLNTALRGGSGISEPVARRFADLLNHDILPEIPLRGSVGQADITLLSHIGLVMEGQWWAQHRGVRKPAAQALADAGLAPVTLLGKDALACFSSNAYSAALAADALAKLTQVRDMLAPVYALSLQAFNGNVAPLMAEPAELRPFPFVTCVAERVRRRLAGSYLFERSAGRALQDPLSYRTAIYQFGGFFRALEEVQSALEIQLNSADDNPVVVMGDVSQTTADLPRVVRVELADVTGAVVPSASFSPLPQVLAQQSAAIAGCHVSEGILNRTLALMDCKLTKLPRFLHGPKAVHGFGAIHKPIGAVAAENLELANPVSMDFASLALGIEDMATNAPRVARRLSRMADNLLVLLGFELLLAAQALDLRRRKTCLPRISSGSRALYAAFREVVPFLEGDTEILTDLIARSEAFIRVARPSEDPETHGI